MRGVDQSDRFFYKSGCFDCSVLLELMQQAKVIRCHLTLIFNVAIFERQNWHHHRVAPERSGLSYAKALAVHTGKSCAHRCKQLVIIL